MHVYMYVIKVTAVGLVKDFLCLLTNAYCLIPAKKAKMFKSPLY